MSTAPSSPPPAPPTAAKSWGNRIAIVIAAALVLVPVTFSTIPREIARWHIAAAQEAEWSEDYDTSLAQIDEAIAVDPQNPDWLLRRARFHESREDYQKALADVREVANLVGNTPGARLLIVSSALAAGEREQAKEELAKLEEVVAADPRNAGLHDNDFAYFKALLDDDLETALKQSNAAINRFYQNQPVLDGIPALLTQILGSDSSKRDLGEASLIDTRGMIYWRTGKLTEARADLDKAIGLAEPIITHQMPHLREFAVDARQLKQMRHEFSKTLAVMRYHRSLIFESLGLKFEAAIDRARVRDLGYKPDETLF